MESEIYNTYVWLCDRGWPDSVIDPLLSNTEDHEITDKSPARFHLKTPPPFVVWHSTCRFYAFKIFSPMASHLQVLWAIWKLHHLQFLHQGLPPAVFEKSTTCRLFCLQQFLHQGVPSSLSVCHPKAPPPAVLKTPPPAAAQMGKSLCMQQGEPAVSIRVQQHHSVSRLAFQMQPLWSDTFKLCIREHANIEKYMSWKYRIYSWFNSQQLEMIIWDE